MQVTQNALITAEIQLVFEQHRDYYRSSRLHRELMASGHRVVRHRVARLMRRAQLNGRTRKAFRPCRQDSGSAILPRAS
ncbi:IS3 family transposase [Synechococcus sp. CBW1006]|uniref:IS3 family transposase n=1 Tax=Synechococcus sp. CBW1006 TaxID=1353138 RepID=UPI0018CF0179|nr:transposase [Synechococcus sp. CBW1006]